MSNTALQLRIFTTTFIVLINQSMMMMPFLCDDMCYAA